MLAIEFLDEIVYGAGETAWPLIRHDLRLTYGAVGVLLAVPRIGAAIVEPVLGLLAGAGYRRRIVLGGGLFFALGMLMVGAASSFWMLLSAFVVMYSASGAFVSLSQATLMDLEPDRRETGMAQWALAGSVGVVAGPIGLTLALVAGFGWRGLYLVMAAVTVLLLVGARRLPYATNDQTPLRDGLQASLAALRSPRILRWLAALEAGDAMGDILTGYIALYVVDVVGIAPVKAAIAVLVLTLAGLAGDILLLPVLRHVSGMRFVRISATAMLAVYPIFLLVPGFLPKLVPLAAIGLLRAGWYAIPQAHLYEEIPESSSSMLVLSNAGSVVAAVIPLAFGYAATRLGFGAAMWLLLCGPVALLALTRGAGDPEAKWVDA